MIYQMSVLPVPNNMNYLLVADALVTALILCKSWCWLMNLVTISFQSRLTH